MDLGADGSGLDLDDAILNTDRVTVKDHFRLGQAYSGLEGEVVLVQGGGHLQDTSLVPNDSTGHDMGISEGVVVVEGVDLVSGEAVDSNLHAIDPGTNSTVDRSSSSSSEDCAATTLLRGR